MSNIIAASAVKCVSTNLLWCQSLRAMHDWWRKLLAYVHKLPFVNAISSRTLPDNQEENSRGALVEVSDLTFAETEPFSSVCERV